MSAFTHVVEVRYGDCDQQGVVFNAHYLAYVDDAMDHWMRSCEGLAWDQGFDVMLKKVIMTWHSPARWQDELAIDCGIGRWGRTSFDVVFRLRVGDRAVADAVITYVSVPTGSTQPMVVPDEARSQLGELVALP